MAPTHRLPIALLTACLAAAALSGCVGGAQASSLYVKDALTDDVAEVHVTFTKAQVKVDQGAWTTVFDGKETIELLSLSAADAREELASFDLEPGAYEALRVVVSEVRVVDHDGEASMLNVFGNIVTIADDFVVGADGIDILVDFDLEAGVNLAAGTYTPRVKDIQTSDDDADLDGLDDVADTDDDNDDLTDDRDDDIDGDGEDDEPVQHHAASMSELCAAERDEELADAQEDLDEELAEAQADLDETLSDANTTDAERAEAQRDYDEDVAEARADFDDETREADAEHTECLADSDEDDRETEDDDRDDEREAEEDEGRDD